VQHWRLYTRPFRTSLIRWINRTRKPVLKERPHVRCTTDAQATAVWLVDNTALSFRQIADFCKLHELEVKGIADGEVAVGIKGMDPIVANQLTRDEIERARRTRPTSSSWPSPRFRSPGRQEEGPEIHPRLAPSGPPGRHHLAAASPPELADSQVMKLVGTTKTTINAIRDRTHWNSANLKPVDPVTLGLCTQLELDLAVQKAAKRVQKASGDAPAPTLLPAEETVPPPYATADAPAEEAPADGMQAADSDAPSADEAFRDFTSSPAQEDSDSEADVDADSVFAKLKELKPTNDDE
jgi:hypothetical protein